MSFKNIPTNVLMMSLENINRRLRAGGIDELSKEQSFAQSNRIIAELEKRGVQEAGYLFKRNDPRPDNKKRVDLDDDNDKTTGGDGDDIDIMLAGAGSGQNRLLGIINEQPTRHSFMKFKTDEARPQVGDPTHEPYLYDNMKYVRQSRGSNRNNILSSI